MYEIKVVERIKINILFQSRLSENRAVYELMSKNLVEPETANDNMVARRMQD
jgi:hypothetical protein